MTKIKACSIKPAHRGLSPHQLMQLRARLRRSACSETWVQDQIITVTEVDRDGDWITKACFDSRVFPPGGRQGTKMRWCRCCGRYTPPQAVQLIERRRERSGPVVSATLRCDDCRIADDDAAHRELYEAGLHLRPSGSQSFVLLRTLFSDRKHAR
jgi:hypothetical protein